MEDGSERSRYATLSRTRSLWRRTELCPYQKRRVGPGFCRNKLLQYLYGNSFRIFTDHRPLLGLFAEHKPIPSLAAARVQRWTLFLAAYNYKLEYRAGSLNGNADCLSRLPLGAQGQDVAPSTNRVHMMNLIDAPVTVAAVRSEMKRDPILSRVYDYTMKGWSSYASIETLKPYFNKLEELTCEGGAILWGSRVIIPSKLRLKVLQQLHQTHIGIVRDCSGCLLKMDRGMCDENIYCYSHGREDERNLRNTWFARVGCEW